MRGDLLSLALVSAMLLCAITAPAKAARCQLNNGDFSTGLDGWSAPFSKPHAANVTAEADRVVYRWDSKIGHSKPGSLFIEVPSDLKPEFYMMQTQLTGIKPNTAYMASVWVKSEDVRDGAGAFAAVEFIDAGGKRIDYQNSTRLMRTQDWQRVTIIFQVPEKTARVTFNCILHGHGKGWFDDAKLEVLQSFPQQPLSAHPKVTIEPNRIINRGIIGIGAEMDPFFFTQANRDAGVDEQDIALYQARVKEMGLKYSRVFVQWHMWNPNADYISRSWDTDFMRALYRNLAFFKEIGVGVNLTNVDWGYDYTPDAKKAAAAEADLLEYLIRTKGFTNIKYVSWSNEPNVDSHWSYASRMQFVVELHDQLVQRKLDKQVGLVEPDAVEDFSWVFAAPKDMGKYLAGYSAHLYTAPRMVGTVTRAIRKVIDAADTGSGRKPFFVNECCAGPKWDYADMVKTVDTVIEAMNNGADAVSIWTLNDAIYDGKEVFRHGLWGYKTENWAPKPVFYAYRLFTKYTDRGTQIIGANSSDPGLIKTLVTRTNGKWAIFVANVSDQATPVTVASKGLPGDLKMCVISEKSLAGIGDKTIDPITPVSIKNGAAVVDMPAQSMALLTDW